MSFYCCFMSLLTHKHTFFSHNWLESVSKHFTVVFSVSIHLVYSAHVTNKLWFDLTLNQHGFHCILQRYAIPFGLHLVGPSFVFQHDNDRTHLQAVWGLFDPEAEWWSAASDDLASTITQSQPIWDGLGWVGVQSEGKCSSKCSAYVGTPSILL